MRFRYTQALLLFLGILLVFLVIVNYLILSHQRNLIIGTSIEHSQFELETMSAAIQEILLRKDYVAIETLLKKWGGKHEEIGGLRAVAPNGFVFGEYVKEGPFLESVPLERRVPYGGDEFLTVEMAVDLTPHVRQLRKLNLRLVLASLAFMSLMGGALWYAMRRKALRPLEEEITEKDARLVEAGHDWEETFDTITDMITLHDRDMNIIRANKAAKDMLELPDPKETESVKCYARYHGTDRPPENCPTCECLKTGKPAEGEFFEPRLDKFLEVRAIPRLDGEQNVIGSIHIARDITERKKLEEQLLHSQKMEALGTLTGGIAHEFNNIMTAILGFAEFLQDGLEEDGRMRTYADVIMTSAERAARLTEGLLAYSRKQILLRERVDVNEIVRTVEILLSSIVPENVDMKTRLAEKELTVHADRARMEQVLMNLATNALDAMPDGGSLTMEAERVSFSRETVKGQSRIAPGEYACVSVADSGEGIDDETQEKMFEPFFTTKEVGKGTGLGLAMVYGTMRRHSGHVTVESEPGRGTVFKVYLPLSRAERVQEEAAAPGAPERGTETVLLAEDDAAVRMLVKETLEKSGYRVIEAVDGEDAVLKFRDNGDGVDLLLFDMVMPGKTGKEAWEEIERTHPEVRVAFISGYVDDIRTSELLEKGHALIPKPVKPKELLSRVREVLVS
jgi:signal transduction histidine kinase